MATVEDRILDERLNELEKKWQGLADFIKDHFIKPFDDTQVYETFCVLCEEYNAALEEAKTAIRSIPNNDRISRGPFVRTVASESIAYKVDRLPASVLKEPGVVRSVDDKLIGQLVERGVIKQSQVIDAQYNKPGRRAVTGPKEVLIPAEFKLDRLK